MRLFRVLVLNAVILAGQPLTSLERHFQGRLVTLLIDMPGDDSGIDIHLPNPAGAQEIAARLNKYGIALKRGQSATVTLVKLKGDHIELQLNGGGFTNKQLLTMPGYDSSRWGTTNAERALHYRITGTKDKKRRRQLQSDYDRLRQRRVKPLRDQYEREQRALHGSRFNIRFANSREAAQVTADDLTVILRPYLEPASPGSAKAPLAGI